MPASHMCSVCCSSTVDCAIVNSHHTCDGLQCDMCFTAVYTLAVDMQQRLHSGAAWVRGCCAQPLLTDPGRDDAPYVVELSVHLLVINDLHV